ncbi:MAG TPA: hypothetical protein PKC28_00620 [Bdellovibrionales bacterium]|nr:hypothetical protein [Bdellovibrionales bacterium]
MSQFAKILALVLCVSVVSVGCETKKKDSKASRKSNAPTFQPETTAEETPAEDETAAAGEKNESGKTPSATDKCGELYEANTELWYPGLRSEPVNDPICTGGKYGEETKGVEACGIEGAYLYTDGKNDLEMANAVKKVDQLDDRQAQSEEFARAVRSVKLHVGNGQAILALMMETLDAKGKVITATYGLKGQVSGGQGALKGKMFNATLTCDSDDCRIANLTVTRESNKGVYTMYIVYRWGQAQVNFANSAPGNKDAKAFAEFMGDYAGECGKGDGFQMQTWAVAYGRAGFEFSAQEDEMKGLYDFTKHTKNPTLSIRGPLLISNKNPMFDIKNLVIEGEMSEQVESATLVANDGSGNVNLQVKFVGEQKPYVRFNATLK